LEADLSSIGSSSFPRSFADIFPHCSVLRAASALSYILFMKTSLASGLTRTAIYVTTMEMRAGQLENDVFSTPAMIGLMERTCVDLTELHLDKNEQTVGIHVDVYHLAPTKIGQSVTITAEVTEVKNEKLRYSVSAVNDQGIKIGAGNHRRAVINTQRFANDK
jgi:fluoroacetyl-CoA thioesterase